MHIFAYVSMCFKLSMVLIRTNNLFIKQLNWLNVILLWALDLYAVKDDKYGKVR